MTLVLMAVGLLVTAAGLLTIGFGIPINAFSLGNTLIISGTIAVVGGLILIGLAARARPIAADRRGAQKQSAGREPPNVTKRSRIRRRALAPEPAPIQPPLHEPWPPNRRVRRSRRARPNRRYAAEPRFPATASEPSPGPLDWLRAKSKPVTTPVPSALVPPAMSEPPMVELTDEAPLSPRSPQRPAMPPAVEAALEPKVWSPNRDAGSQEPRLAPRSEQPMPRATPQVEPPKEKERFDLVWPDRGAAPAPSEPKPETVRASRGSSNKPEPGEARARARDAAAADSGAPARNAAGHRKTHARNSAQADRRAGTHDPQVRRDRRHALHALCRRLDRSSIAARHGEIRVRRRAARASRKAKLTRRRIRINNAGSARSRRFALADFDMRPVQRCSPVGFLDDLP